jgi:hypothetical protein
MAAEHDFIDRLLRPHLRPMRVRWLRAMTAMETMAGTRSAESTEVMLKVLRRTGPLQVRVTESHPHLFSPLESLQLLALQVLAAWGPEHRAEIEAFADTTESETLELIALSCLNRLERSQRP